MIIGSNKVIVVLTAIGLLLLSSPFESSMSAASSPAYPNTSWAVGVVVPQGAHLIGGGSVEWQSVTNVTAEVTLPNITLPDRNIYAVLSVMTGDGSVLQAAAGALPDRSVWLTFGWLVPTVNTAQLTYNWILNASEPEMAPGANVSISIFLASGSWNLEVSDSLSGASVVKAFPPGISTSLKPGDQEVFAFESYSRAGSVFQGMGNLTLGALMLDGHQVTGGTYTYGQWDPSHSPLFTVGSFGASPPAFISIGQGAGGSYFWYYAVAWRGAGDPYAGLAQMGVIVLIIAGFALFGLAIWAARRPKGEGDRQTSFRGS